MDSIIEKGFDELAGFLEESGWYGRENEVVNLFCHSFLAKHVSLAQVGIEVAVKQLPSDNGKALVRKDLVIWGADYQTVWNDLREPVNDPVAIIEWKTNSLAKCTGDIEWLKKYTKIYPNVTGYSVCVFIKDSREIKYTKVKNGEIV